MDCHGRPEAYPLTFASPEAGLQWPEFPARPRPWATYERTHLGDFAAPRGAARRCCLERVRGALHAAAVPLGPEIEPAARGCRRAGAGGVCVAAYAAANVPVRQ